MSGTLVSILTSLLRAFVSTLMVNMFGYSLTEESQEIKMDALNNNFEVCPHDSF